MKSARKDWMFLGVFWVLFTVIGLLMVWKANLLPAGYAEEAEIGDEAYKLLIGLAVPIFAGVCAALLTILVRQVDKHTSDEIETEDGPHVLTHKKLVHVWVGVSAVLAIGLAVDPGFVGLRDIRGESKADLVVEVTAQRWSWKYTYEGGEFSTTELVLPIDQRVRFDITSVDIVHSFWVPGFRQKLDAVPGRITKLYITPNELGDGTVDPTLRVQCAELCGIDHALMATPIRIVTEAEFEAWLASIRKEG
jgi:cytochrome c oxidase subunit 2